MHLHNVSKEALMGRRLFLDLDGVMMDFEQHYIDCFGPKPNDDDLMWETIHAHGEFFATMPLMPGAKDFFEEIKHLDPIICTACSKTHYADVAKQKRQCVREKLTTDHLILPTWGGASKPLFMHAPGDILIDDWKRNIDLWRKAGGIGIKHTSMPETSLELSAMIADKFRKVEKYMTFAIQYGDGHV